MRPLVLHVSLPVPLRKLFDYLAPTDQGETTYQKGGRVLVPFGNQELVGIVMSVDHVSDFPLDKLKPIKQKLDDRPIIPSDIMRLCQWAATYYHHPVGEVLHGALPKTLRKPPSTTKRQVTQWRHTQEGLGLSEDALQRSPKQQALHRLLLQHREITSVDLKNAGITTSTAKALETKGLIQRETVCSGTQLSNQSIPPSPANASSRMNSPDSILATPHLTLNEEQSAALGRIRYHQFTCYLLEGTTGSGKTEVYLHAIARTLQTGKQVLVLVPEIGLTPQTLNRFRTRFNVEIVEIHSGMSDNARTAHWLQASSGQARVVIGTRLAVFTPFLELGLIIVDEEHDSSFKQQGGLSYSARDTAVVRAKDHNIPLILGSATPSLESLHNALSGRFQHLRLSRRAAEAKEPKIVLSDMRQQLIDSGLGQTCLNTIKQTIAKNEQVLVFLNRRGFAPAFLCQDCGWTATCHRCDAKYTLHRQPHHLRCHHCDTQRRPPSQCPNCHSPRLIATGQGTERSEEALQNHFPDTPVIRVDQDSMRSKGAMTKLYERINLGDVCILVGTQMLAKGHHFPKVTLVVIVDIDQGFLSGDFRGAENMGQLITQVTGRAGRADLPGQAIIQTYRPDHPLLELLVTQGYAPFSRSVLNERQQAQLPPFTYMALIKAESKRPENASEFLKMARATAQQIFPPNPTQQYLGPIPGLLEKKQSRWRFQLQIRFKHRGHLHQLLTALIPLLEENALAKRTRWSVDIDPIDFS